jgi:TolB protein
MGRVGRVVSALAWGFGTLAGSGAAQERDSIPGVSLGLLYETSFAPAIAVKAFSEGEGVTGVALQVEAIIGRDLRNADRFEVLDSMPASVMGEGVDYVLWDRLGAVWLVSGRMESVQDSFVLHLQLHDVLFGEVREDARFMLPAQADDDFRMAVHRISDQIVEWTTGEPGMAASRIAFAMPAGDGQKEIYVIDSDGENLRRITDAADIALSPSWSPDASRIAYMTWVDGRQRIIERWLGTGEESMIDAARDGNYLTPTYHPDGQTMAFSVSGGTRSGLFTYDVRRSCCLAYLSGGPGWDDVSPTYSPDGRWMAFNTNRFGTETPQIMTMPGGGGGAETLSPYEYGSGGYYTSPDWSPLGDFVAFHGRIRRGRYQILVADLRDQGRRLRQLTWEGNNEDPTWAPDGRHLAFVGERDWGFGLFVVDVATGRIRALISGRRVSVPDWSGPLAPSR